MKSKKQKGLYPSLDTVPIKKEEKGIACPSYIYRIKDKYDESMNKECQTS